MRYILTILALVMAIAVDADAQSIRLGDRIPDTQFGKELDVAYKEHVCLAFINTESAPCLSAVESIVNIIGAHSRSIELVFVCNQAPGCEKDIAHITEGIKHTMAYDSEARIFKAYGIEYVPYMVIYSTKRSRIEWFGSMRQLSEKTIEQIINK